MQEAWIETNCKRLARFSSSSGRDWLSDDDNNDGDNDDDDEYEWLGWFHSEVETSSVLTDLVER